MRARTYGRLYKAGSKTINSIYLASNYTQASKPIPVISIINTALFHAPEQSRSNIQKGNKHNMEKTKKKDKNVKH